MRRHTREGDKWVNLEFVPHRWQRVLNGCKSLVEVSERRNQTILMVRLRSKVDRFEEEILSD